VHDGVFLAIKVVFMQKLAKATILGTLLFVGGCAAMNRTPPAVGDPLATVTAKFGPPTAVYPGPDGQVLEYATGPFGQYTYMARMGPDGRLASFEQVLTSEKFGTLKIGAATKDEVLRTLGRPAERSYLARMVVSLQGKRRLEFHDACAFRPRRRAENAAERTRSHVRRETLFPGLTARSRITNRALAFFFGNIDNY
jgi:hypothetical protein